MKPKQKIRIAQWVEYQKMGPTDSVFTLGLGGWFFMNIHNQEA